MMRKTVFYLSCVAALLLVGYCFQACYQTEKKAPVHVTPGEGEGDDEENTDTVQVANTGVHCTYFTLHRHSTGKGVAIIMVGDGFSREDNKPGGFYESVCRELADKFLSNPIIRDFVDWFDIYGVVAESPTSGIHPDNIFGSGAGNANFEAANAFTCEAIPGLAANIRRSWIFIGNGMIGGYANFGYEGNCGSAVYSTAEGVSGYWMAHEFIGHGFASLGDEYGLAFEVDDYYGDPGALQKSGMCMNVSSTGNTALVPWKDFIGREGYEEVGAFLGAFGSSHYYRPEEWSIMVDNRHGSEGDEALYYNAPSRWIIYKRIHYAAELEASFDEFLEYDKKYNVK